MLDKSILSALLLGAQASATYLYVSSYSGDVTTLSFDGETLETVATTNECATAPSWLTLDKSKNILYCADEGFGTWPNGTVVAFEPQEDGSLTVLSKETTLVGAVSILQYGPENSGIAVAYYGGSAFTTWDASDPAALELLHTSIYELEEPGANPDRQEAPHPHQAISDPTGAFILIPDLGADLVRIYSIDESGLGVASIEPLAVPAGSGPRHATFAVHGETTYFYVVNELSNTIIGYVVSYTDGGISFEEVYQSGTHGVDGEVPSTAAAAEITVTPDQAFLIVSSRNESAFNIPSFDPASNATIVSDTLINFSIDPATGALTTLQEVPSGGRFPRHFSFNADTTLLATTQQQDGRVVIIERDPETGLLGDFVTTADVEGEVTNVVFHES